MKPEHVYGSVALGWPEESKGEERADSQPVYSACYTTRPDGLRAMPKV